MQTQTVSELIKLLSTYFRDDEPIVALYFTCEEFQNSEGEPATPEQFKKACSQMTRNLGYIEGDVTNAIQDALYSLD